ncbi:hypothetical protein QBC38DRAFT_366525 [Podospora fimiseda]|uniref:RBR-type E3 ubiquitin transferase n=1 Tax=Podospora fimiseda TaxID=252190 RepID=A0AAN7GT72_9PEZI|nr:hypothetical protein QBC38DRAFT_366525 [Podospora fimiseda]
MTKDLFAAADGTTTTTITHECVVCGDFFSPAMLATALCGHRFCGDCFRRFVSAGMADEQLFPPNCCQQKIPGHLLQPWLSQKDYDRYRARKVEVETANRTYCHHPACATFIPPSAIDGDVATCPKCSARTCTICKGNIHIDANCLEDKEAEATLGYVKGLGWKRCPKCKEVVEKNAGCSHIKCRCGCDFCYVCGNKMFTDKWEALSCPICDSPSFTNEQLLELRRQGEQVPIQAISCLHQSWRGITGPGECESCHKEMPKFLFRCRACVVVFCRDCRPRPPRARRWEDY